MSQFDRLGNDMSDDIADHYAWEDMAREQHTSYLEENELTGYEEHLRDSEGYGDARRCPRHPHVKTSSDDGLHDADCGQCEYEGEEAYQEQQDAEELAAMPQWMKCRTLSDIIHCEVGQGGLAQKVWFAMINAQPCPEVSFWGQQCDTDSIPF